MVLCVRCVILAVRFYIFAFHPCGSRVCVAFVGYQCNSSEFLLRILISSGFVVQGNLPVALIFDYPEMNLGPGSIESLSNKYGVYIAVRTKSRQSTSCVVIKGVEKFVGK